MLQFIKFTFATIVGLFLFLFFGLFLLVAIIAASSGGGQPVVKVESNSVLRLNLNQSIAEQGIDNPFEELPFFGKASQLGLIELRAALQKAKADDHIKGIYFEASGIGATGFASLQEIRDMLADFRKSGKFIHAYSAGISEGTYYVASVADKIFVHPAGNLELNGLNIQIMFYKNTLEKIGVKPEVFRVGAFKGAVEPFILDKMSDENRLQYTSFLNNVYDHILADIAEGRKIPLEELRNIAGQMLVQTPADAIKYKLVTDTAYYDQVEAGLKKAAGIAETDKIKFVAIHDYMKTAAESNSGKTDKVAVIIAEGDIVDGKGARGMIGGDAIAAELRKVRLDKNVKAVVLRINSGGGSALASDIMWREVELLKKAKPVIASMSDYAASGGYYMAMACNTIVARPNTITGSIGVFGLTFNAQELMNSKLGVTFDNVKTGQYADLGDASRPLTDSERRILQNGVERIYKDFTGKVAAGRRLPLDSVLRIAGGRVWTGTQAKAIGLVDVLGSYEDAVELAAKQAKLTKGDYELKFYPKKETIWEVLAGSEDLIRAQVLKSELGEFYPIYQQTKQLLHLRGIQARMPFQLRIN